MTKLVFVGNCYPFRIKHTPGESMADAMKAHGDLIDRHQCGPPQATERYTVEELRADGMIGLYEKPLNHPQPPSRDDFRKPAQDNPEEETD